MSESYSPRADVARFDAASDRVTARRRFLTRGLVGGPVTLVVATRSVEALATTYCHYSAYHSALGGNTTSLATQSCAAGFSVAHWAAVAPGQYPGTGNVNFNVAFGSGTSDKFNAILNSPGSYSRHEADFVAAYLNAEAGIANYLLNAGNAAPDGVVYLWNQWSPLFADNSYWQFLQQLDTAA